jgi:hypothetical protein
MRFFFHAVFRRFLLAILPQCLKTALLLGTGSNSGLRKGSAGCRLAREGAGGSEKMGEGSSRGVASGMEGATIMEIKTSTGPSGRGTVYTQI